MENKAFFNFC